MSDGKIIPGLFAQFTKYNRIHSPTYRQQQFIFLVKKILLLDKFFESLK